MNSKPLEKAVTLKERVLLMMDKKYYFQKLTPVSNANISVYEEAINFVFNNLDIKNVAISGAYSSGKSSILGSYKIKHEKHKFMHISLAHFRTSQQESSESRESVKESVLEGKILNQLIHQIPAEKIPQTNFRVKKGVSSKNIALLTTFVSLFIGSFLFLHLSMEVVLFIEALPNNWVKSILSIFFSPYATIVDTLIYIACSVVFIYSLIKAQKNKNIFRKINLQGNEIEIFEEQDDSYFDKYLNEVLYLFENVDADVIVFEDMDRLNASRIFERLREVNNLVNIQRKNKQGTKYVPLRFFYLLRDDIFVSKDRTKFFDFIIPIVPIVDNSNSYEQFLKHLAEGKLLDKFDLSFLQSLSLYIDDMRILKNIYNEFVVYIHRLNTTDLDWNKMMAMIAYKNLFPRDFSNLQLAKGFVFALFEQKPLLIKSALDSTKGQRQELLNRIEWVKKETLSSKQELDDVYVAKYNRLPRGGYNNQTLSPEGQELKKQYDIELPKRKQAIQDMLDGNLPKLEAELADIEHDIFLTQTKSLKDLITRENIDTVFSVSNINGINGVDEFREIKSSDYFALLKFLIRFGHIDETYTDYMTYFYDESISVNDKIYLRRITDRRGAEYTYRLKEPRKVIESPVLRAVEFEQEETLNYDLFECLLLNDTISEYAIYLKTIIAQIKRTRNSGFLSKFYDTDKAHKQFVIRINEQWPDFFSLVLQEKTMPPDQVRQYSIDTLCFSDDEVIDTVNVDSCLTKYISQCPDYLVIEQPDIDKLVSGFLLIGVRFDTINYEKSDKALFNEVYQHSLYILTFKNIVLMLKKKYGFEEEFEIIHKNYTVVKSQVDSPLARYISENMSAYTEIILDNCNGSIFDDESVAISILNNADVEIATKKRYIELLATVISEIIQVAEQNLWKVLIKQRVVAFSTINFVNYFEEHEIDAILIEYINNEPSEIDFTPIINVFGEETAERLFDAIAVCNGITNDKYRKILIDLGYYFNNFDADEITDEKFEVLVNEGILQMDTEGLKFVRDKYAKHLYVFAKRNLDEYLALQTDEIFMLEEAMQIITWDIDDEQKMELLAFTNEQISIVGKQYTDVVNAYIITHNFKVEEKQYLYEHFLQYGEKTRTVIVALASAGVGEIITNNMRIDDSLLSILFQSDVIIREQKILLFIMVIPILNEETCKIHFDELELSSLKGIFTRGGGRRNYEKNGDITMVLDALKLNGWIYEYYDDERNNDKYIIVKNKPQSKELEILD